MWPSNYSWNWNSVDVGPKRDIVGKQISIFFFPLLFIRQAYAVVFLLAEMRGSILKTGGVHFGLYFSLFEWFNRLYIKDKNNAFRTQDYVSVRIWSAPSTAGKSLYCNASVMYCKNPIPILFFISPGLIHETSQYFYRVSIRYP